MNCGYCDWEADSTYRWLIVGDEWVCPDCQPSLSSRFTWVTAAEAAVTLGITVTRVHQLIQRPVAERHRADALPPLASRRVGSIWLVTRESVEARAAAACRQTPQ